MTLSSSASGNVPTSAQEQVANVIEELQILGSLDKLIAVSEVSYSTLHNPDISRTNTFVFHQLRGPVQFNTYRFLI